ncbi:extracellular solute-binding protein [Falsarthrobacter nasiphocae]|uniref:Iron(III) transport system substrate-binding protein n=1 Tax=Falsarthrobacter nasiphocae TaxID=189863 RepID=A0AAE4C684_9MICC|nr:extracellular solute-binding protein [Falsarthrobacter nasiphocae]MDR6891862.1 iron(III) transport system substrate-binding protein [Falsarthrobacter nasiphocae]
MERRRFLQLSVLTAAATSLAACTPPSQNSSGGSDNSLVVYSNSLSDGRKEWLQGEAKTAGFDLSFVDLGGGDIMNRLVAEKNNPMADVVFGLNNVYFEKLNKAGVLAASTPKWAGEVDAKLGNEKEYWPIVREPIMLVYNEAVYKTPADAPQDWPELWTNEKFAKKYEVPSSLGGATTQMVLSGILTRFKGDGGDLGITKEGWDAVKAYFEKGVPSVKGQDLYAQMKAGKVNAGQMYLAGKPQREKQYGIKTQAVHPKTGVPMVVQHISLVKGTKKEAKAKEFIDWLGGAEMQAKWSKKFFTAPVNKNALANADAEAVKITDSFSAQDIDWVFVAENIDKWVEKIQLEILK